MQDALPNLNPPEPDERPLQILIADDSPVSRKILESSITKWGFEVIGVSDGTRAWEILSQDESPQIAILDWVMPGLSGPDVCRLVRQQSKPYYTYIILLTSKHNKADLIAGMESGADDYLVKPVDNNELKVRLGPGRRIVELQRELARAQEALRIQATRDALTRLWNRHALFDILGRELSRARRQMSPLGILIADIDRFKSINDTYGHLSGDLVLKEVALRLASSIRPYDSAGRYGGEEFLVLLVNCGAEEAMMSSERIREHIQATPIPVLGAELSVTASFGVTNLPAGASASPEALIRAADDALYRAKEEGRNRCCYQALA